MGESARRLRSAASRPWRGTTGHVLLGALGVAALITIFLWRGSGKIVEPAPLPEPAGKTVTALSASQRTAVQVQVGEYIRLALPADGSYTTVVEQSDPNHPIVEDLKLPGQQPQLRADSSGVATVEVMKEPVCDASGACTGRRALYGTLAITVTP